MAVSQRRHILNMGPSVGIFGIEPIPQINVGQSEICHQQKALYWIVGSWKKPFSYVCIHTYIHTYIHTCIRTYIAYIYIFIYIYLYIYLYMYVCNVCMYVCMYILGYGPLGLVIRCKAVLSGTGYLREAKTGTGAFASLASRQVAHDH